MTLTREGDFVGSQDDNVEEIKFFDGQFNRITFEQVVDWNLAPQVYKTFAQVYTKTFKCTYQLQLYPFDTQVRCLSMCLLRRQTMEMTKTFKVCTVDLIVRLLETSVMKVTPNKLMMESGTVLTQYIITNW